MEKVFRAIRHFQISHNAPYLPPKILHKHCLIFSFSWDGCNTQHKRKTKVMQIFFGANRVNYGKFGSGVDYSRERPPKGELATIP